MPAPTPRPAHDRWCGAGAAVAGARPVLLVRYRPGAAGETARTVHVVRLPTHEQSGAVGTLCGAALLLRDVETVTPGDGMPAPCASSTTR